MKREIEYFPSFETWKEQEVKGFIVVKGEVNSEKLQVSGLASITSRANQ